MVLLNSHRSLVDRWAMKRLAVVTTDASVVCDACACVAAKWQNVLCLLVAYELRRYFDAKSREPIR